MIDYSLKENWTKSMLISTLETYCVLTDEEKESFDRLWIEKLDCEKVTGTIIQPANEIRLYSKNETGEEENDFILVESHYFEEKDGYEKPDAVSFTVGQFVGYENPNNKVPFATGSDFEYYNMITVSTEEARLFAQAILKLCDEIEGK